MAAQESPQDERAIREEAERIAAVPEDVESIVASLTKRRLRIAEWFANDQEAFLDELTHRQHPTVPGDFFDLTSRYGIKQVFHTVRYLESWRKRFRTSLLSVDKSINPNAYIALSRVRDSITGDQSGLTPSSAFRIDKSLSIYLCEHSDLERYTVAYRLLDRDGTLPHTESDTASGIAHNVLNCEIGLHTLVPPDPTGDVAGDTRRLVKEAVQLIQSEGWTREDLPLIGAEWAGHFQSRTNAFARIEALLSVLDEVELDDPFLWSEGVDNGKQPGEPSMTNSVHALRVLEHLRGHNVTTGTYVDIEKSIDLAAEAGQPSGLASRKGATRALKALGVRQCSAQTLKENLERHVQALRAAAEGNRDEKTG